MSYKCLQITNTVFADSKPVADIIVKSIKRGLDKQKIRGVYWLIVNFLLEMNV